MEAGVDSLGAVELRNALGTRFGVELPATVTLDFPSIAALSAHLATVVAQSDDVIRADDVASCTSSVSYSHELQVCPCLPQHVNHAQSLHCLPLDKTITQTITIQSDVL